MQYRALNGWSVDGTGASRLRKGPSGLRIVSVHGSGAASIVSDLDESVGCSWVLVGDSLYRRPMGVASVSRR